MSTLSKFCSEILGLNIYTENCYEFGHTWNPGCYSAILDAFTQSCSFSFKTYAIVYLIDAFISRKLMSKNDLLRILKDTSRSSLFLVVNVAAFLWFMCQIRRLLGFYVLPTMGLVNGFLSSLLSIFIESPRRRPMLALYLTNLASETAFHQLVNHGYLKYIPKGQIILFAIALGGFIYLLRKNRLSCRIRSLLRFTHYTEDEREVISNEVLRKQHYLISKGFLYLRDRFSKNHFCKHSHSCISRCVECFCKNFAIGFGLQLSLHCLQNFKKLVTRPVVFFKRFIRYKNLRFALFFGSLPLIYQFSRCFLNRILNARETLIRDALCGALSAVSMLFYPSTSIAMYMLWKYIEACYITLANDGYLPFVPYASVLLYAFSTGYVLWNVVIEPNNLRRGYWEFLVSLTAQKVKLLNRRVFDSASRRTSHKFSGFKLAIPCGCSYFPAKAA
uniref:TMEM135_C_rich domain-containing protein n=1 Tax=Syphacia muris TaxID=451379 RepID=A0A0N5AY52_9BILA